MFDNEYSFFLVINARADLTAVVASDVYLLVIVQICVLILCASHGSCVFIKPRADVP